MTNWSDYEIEYFHPQIRYVADITKNLANICLIKSTYKPLIKFNSTGCALGTCGPAKSSKIKMTTSKTSRIEPIPNNFFKVLVSVFISGPRHSLYHRQKLMRKVFMSTDKEWYSDNFIAFKVNSCSEMHSLYSYLTSWIVSDLFSIAKTTRNVSDSSFMYVPLVPLDREWESDSIIKWVSQFVNRPRRWLRELPTGLEWCGPESTNLLRM
jgi:hypothetical protein